MSAYLLPSDILLPDFSAVNGTLWATVACDQFTGEPDYWQTLDARVGEAPSTLRLILPEAFLGEAAARIPAVHETMENYYRHLLVRHKNSVIYLERTLANGRVRRGLIGMVDLEQYDYREGATSLIRATEQTVTERIPPRLAVRRDALLELPHVMLLIDDPQKTVIEPLAASTARMKPAYAFPLTPGSGSLKAWFADAAGFGRASVALERLVSPERMRARYGENAAPLLFAVGDGNHSLAVAKAAYQEIKAAHGESALFHPARYALVEVVNLHDPALTFEPIYRVLSHVDTNDVLQRLEAFSFSQHGAAAPQQTRFISKDRRGTMHFGHPSAELTVATLQQFLDAYMADHPEAELDYIHSAKTVEGLSAHPDTVGFLFAGMQKDDLFRTVVQNGALPRKTFSMGAAEDKRFYVECRRIR